MKHTAPGLDTNVAASWQTWQIERFLNNVAVHIQDGSAFLQVNRSWSYSETEEESRWQAEDFINALLAARPWLGNNPVPVIAYSKWGA